MKYILLAFFLIAGNHWLSAKTQPSSSVERASVRLNTLSGQNLNSSSHFSEDSIIHLARQVEMNYLKSGNLAEEIKAGQIQVNSYGLQGKLGLASNKAQQLMERAVQTQDELALGLAIQSMGDTYMHAARYKQADSVFTEAQTHIHKHGTTLMKLQLMLQHLDVYINLRDNELSLQTINQIRNTLNNKELLIPDKKHYWLLLNCYELAYAIATNNADLAHQKMNLIKQGKSPKELSNLWFYTLASHYFSFLEENDIALSYSDSAIQQAQKGPNKNILRNAMMSRTTLLERIGRDDEACKTYQQLVTLTDSLFQTQYVSQIDTLHMTYLVDQLQMSNITRRNSFYAKMIGGMFGLVFVTILIVLLIRRQNRQLEESRLQLAMMREATKDSIHSKSLFLSNMSHELRTPLNAIVGFTNILTENDETDDETREQCSSYIRQNADLLMKLINDVVDFSGLQGASIQFSFTPCDIVTLCHNVLDTINNVKRTQAEMQFVTDLKDLTFNTDSNRLQQVLINLLVNATKFTQTGNITLRLYTDSAADEAIFSVEDTGCGIPLEKQSFIFDRFEKLQENTQGAGLGLSICRLIVEHMGGRIWIDPTYTGGARFIFTHPLHYTPKES